MLHVLEFLWDDYAIVVAAVTRPNANQFVGFRIDEGNAALQTLKTTEHTDYVFAVVGYCQGLHIWPDPLDLFLDLPRVGVDHHNPAACWRWMQNREVELRAIH